jgi:hypothetical protein
VWCPPLGAREALRISMTWHESLFKQAKILITI